MRREREGRQESPFILGPCGPGSQLTRSSLLLLFLLPLKLDQSSPWSGHSLRSALMKLLQRPIACSCLASLPFSLESATNTWPPHSDVGSDIRQGLGSSCCFFLCSWTCLLGTSEAGRSSGSHLSADRMWHTNACSPGTCNWRYGLFMPVMKAGDSLQLQGEIMRAWDRQAAFLGP